MKKKGLLLIILSVVLGAATFMGLYYYIKTVNKEIEVVSASQNIPPYTEIKAPMLKLEKKPAYTISNDAATKIEYVIGMYTGDYGIFENDTIYRYKVKKHDEIKDKVLGEEMADESRAIAVKVDLVKSVAGIIKANDYVDISIVNENFSVTPIESIKILSVKDIDGYEISNTDYEGEKKPLPSAVILEALTPEIRDTIVLITDKGQVHLSLVKPTDVKTTEINQDAVKTIKENTNDNKEQINNTNSSGEVVNTHF